MTLEKRIRRLEEIVAHISSTIDDIAWDGTAHLEDLKVLSAFASQIWRELEAIELEEAERARDRIRTVAGEDSA